MKAGAQLDIKSLKGNTALMLAAQSGHKAVVKGLLEHGADSALRNRQRDQAVNLAASAGHQDIAVLLEKQENSKFWLLKGF